MNVAIVPVQFTAPGTDTPPVPIVTIKVEAVTVVGSILLLKVALMVLPVATPVAPIAGDVETTVGGVMSFTVTTTDMDFVYPSAESVTVYVMV